MIVTNLELKNLKVIRDAKHTKIFKGNFNDEVYYLKVLKNYNKKVRKQDVLRSKKLLEELGMKCFDIVETGLVGDEKYYITKEVKGKDFEELIEEGKTFEEIEVKLKESMITFMKMLNNSLFYFGYNLKNFMLVNDELILIDIEEVQKKIFFKRKARMKTIWNSLRSLESGARRTGIPYKTLEEMMFSAYSEVLGDPSDLKKDISRYKRLRDIKKKR